MKIVPVTDTAEITALNDMSAKPVLYIYRRDLKIKAIFLSANDVQLRTVKGDHEA